VRAGFVAAALCGATLVAAAQQPPLPTFRSAIELTTVTATVVDQDGHLVTGLPRDAFEVFEDGVAQQITQFTNQRVPVSLGLLIDASDSMFGRRIHDARDAIDQFAERLLDPVDEFAILAFNHRQMLLTEWTADRASAATALGPLRPWGATAIYDAVASALPLVATRHRQRAALLIVSDGADTASDMSLRDLRAALLRSDAFVYAVAIDSTDRGPINAAVNPMALREVTDQSGGRTLVVHDSDGVAGALSEIADELNSQYLIGYTSAKGADGQFHTIRVRVKEREYRVRARGGYVARRASEPR
jgi:Ca-activated chloride channel family protein